MKKLLIGYGNSLRRDDGVGPYLAARFEPTDELDVIVCHQLTPELAEPLSRARRAVFVDASTNAGPGTITVEKLLPRASALVHRLNPGTLLAWSIKLYGRAPEAFIVGIGGESFDLGEGLSPAVQEAAEEALEAIRVLLHSPATDNQANQEQDKEDNEKYLRDSCRGGSNPAEPENSCQDGNY